MANAITVDIDPDIKLDPERTKGMPEEVKGGLLTLMTHSAKKHDCHWTKLTWSVKMVANQPVIKVKHETN